MSAKTILKIQNLDISFRTNAGVIHAIRGVDLDLQKGETVAIVGESGSGKSVTMKAVVGLLDSNATINSGEIFYTYEDSSGNDQTIDLLKISKKQGALTFKKVKGSKKITIAKKTGKVKVLKGTKKGTYKVTVQVKAAGNSNYKALTKKVTFKVKVK